MPSRLRFQSLVLALLAFPVLVFCGQRSRTLVRDIVGKTANGQVSVIILPAASGAPLLNYGPGSTSLSLGHVAYYGRGEAFGVRARRTPEALILSTRFGLKVECGGWQPSFAEVTVSLVDLDPSYAVSMDGKRLSVAPLPIPTRCGVVTEHLIEMQIPAAHPDGPIGNKVAFLATVR